MKVRWRQVLILAAIAVIAHVFLGVLIRLLRGFFVPGGIGTEATPDILIYAVAEVLFILARCGVDVGAGCFYSFFTRRPSPLSFGEATVGGALVGALSKIPSCLLLSLIDFITLFFLQTGSYIPMEGVPLNPSPFTRWSIASLLSITVGTLWGTMLTGFSSGLVSVFLRRRSRPAPEKGSQTSVPEVSRPVSTPKYAPKGARTSAIDAELNPFAFPVDTQPRSLFLIVGIVALSFLYGFALLIAFFAIPDGAPGMSQIREPIFKSWRTQSALPEDQNAFNPFEGPLYNPDGRAREGELKSELDSLTGISEVPNERIENIFGELHTIQTSEIGLIWPYFGVPFAFVVLMAMLWTLLYLTHAWRLRRSGQIQELSETTLKETVAQFIAEAGVRHHAQTKIPLKMPEILERRGIRSEGQAFGFPGSYFIVLNRSLRTFLRKDDKYPGLARAIVLHEVAHIVNRDVGRSYFAASAWVIIGILTFLGVLAPLIESLYSRTASIALELLPFLVKMGFTLVFFELIRRSILRGREYLADLRAALFWQAREALLDVIDKTDSREWPLITRLRFMERIPGFNRFVTWLKEILSLHPSGSSRKRVIRDPDLAFEIRSDIAYFSGVLLNYALLMVAVILVSAVPLGAALAEIIAIRMSLACLDVYGSGAAIGVYRFLQGSGGFVIFISAILVVIGAGYLIASTVSIQIQRVAVAQLARGERGLRPYVSLIRPAFFTAAGLGSGLLLVPFIPIGISGIRLFLLIVLWSVLAAAPIWLWMSGTYFFTQRLLGAHVGSNPPHRKRIFLTAYSVINLSIAFFLIYFTLGLIFVSPGESTSEFGWWITAVGAPGCVILVLLTSLVAMGFGLGALQVLWAKISPARCPSCNEKTARSPAVAECCEHCGDVLAPWLFVLDKMRYDRRNE